GCLRELREETRLKIPVPVLKGSIKGTNVFDHPERSQRGRTITHAHYFDLGNTALPHLTADDDAQEAQWVPIDALGGREDEFFEDHFHMLDHFLGLRLRP
ncbi:MAG: NUDIX domain-containing protein, partial [Acidovorax sp.]